MAQIHPTAIIADGAKIAPDATVGAYCVIGPEVIIGSATVLESHVVIGGKTTLGAHNQVFPFVSLGHAPQDLKYHGEPSHLVIGSFNIIREHATMNPGTEGGGMLTKVGDHGLFMVGTHVAHDCRIGNRVIMANNATLAGHVEVGEQALIGGLSAVHQFVRIGKHAVIGGMSGVEHDVIPYGSVMGERASLAGLNLVGMKRRGYSRESIHAVRRAFKELFEIGTGTLTERASNLREQYKNHVEVMEILSFMQEGSKRSLCIPKAGTTLGEDAA